MPWVRALLRGTTVFARADADGALAADGATVEIRYKPSDGRRYRARRDNLTVQPGELLPDSFCGDADAVSKDARPAARRDDGAAAVASRPGAVLAYTDGACTGNPGPAGLGVVVLGEGGVELSEYLGHATNNIAELTAILRALERVPRDRPIVVHTDSQYAIGVLQKGWKAKANQELIATIKRALSGREAALVYVRGHAGVTWNERCDQLAREAVSLRRTHEKAVSYRA